MKKFKILIRFENINISYNYRMKNGDKKNKIVYNKDLVAVKGWKTIGNRLDNKARMSGFEFHNISSHNTDDKDENVNLENESENLTLF